MTKEKVLFVGVSPKPYCGCNYWYLDESGETMPHTFVYVKMGRHDRLQPVYVDSVLWCDIDKTPYPIDRVKRVVRQATEEESEVAKKEWKEEQNMFA